MTMVLIVAYLFFYILHILLFNWHLSSRPAVCKIQYAHIYSSIQKLNEMGAKKIAFIGIPPIGCCPSQRELGSRECDPMRNQAANLFNSEIEKEIQRLEAEQNVQGSKFIYLDIYYNLLDLIQRSDFYGECTLYTRLLFQIIPSIITVEYICYRHINK